MRLAGLEFKCAAWKIPKEQSCMLLKKMIAVFEHAIHIESSDSPVTWVVQMMNEIVCVLSK